jgi:hypothetical protein
MKKPKYVWVILDTLGNDGPFIFLSKKDAKREYKCMKEVDEAQSLDGKTTILKPIKYKRV